MSFGKLYFSTKIREERVLMIIRRFQDTENPVRLISLVLILQCLGMHRRSGAIMAPTLDRWRYSGVRPFRK